MGGANISYVVFWLALAVVLALAEAATAALVSIWLCVGAVAAAVVASCGGSVTAQFVTFVVTGAVLVPLTRPIAKRLMKNKQATNADRVVGETGLVTEEIEPLQNTGQVKVLGQMWTARSHDGSTIPAGANVKIERIEGAKVIVTKL